MATTPSDPSSQPSRAETITRIGLSTLLVLVCVALLLPRVPTDIWFVRVLEFPRLQLTLLGVVVLLGALTVTRTPRQAGSLAVALLPLGYSTWVLWPFALPGAAQPLGRCAPGDGSSGQLDVLVANVQSSNRQSDAFLELVAATDPDVLLVLETNAWWDDALRPLDARFAHHTEATHTEQHYGMHLYARPAMDAEVVYLVDNDIPTIEAELESGLRLFALHPRPPQIGESAEHRDEQLRRAAEAIARSDTPVIALGDFNAVPWEGVFERFQQDAGLTDPRETRGRLSSYQPSGWPAWPLDHVLWRGEELTLAGLELMRDIGSDHRPVLARFCRD